MEQDRVARGALGKVEYPTGAWVAGRPVRPEAVVVECLIHPGLCCLGVGAQDHPSMWRRSSVQCTGL